MINFIGTFNVIPSLPKKLEPLREIVYNLYWSWNQDALELFRRLDRDLWEKTNHNPVAMLGLMNQSRLEELAADDGFVSHMNRVYVQLNVYMEETAWFDKTYKQKDKAVIAYFSAEFGLTECLPIYSGGLGVLAGDHLKSASDLGLPLVGVGLCYKEGYFQQYLNADGWQQEKYDLTDFFNQPMELIRGEDGNALKMELDFPGRKVFFQIWKIQVGRIPLYLLDTNVSENSPEDRKITRALYGGNIESRIQQEILLGMGGIKALHAIGIKPQVCHMNEGHSAFLSLQRIHYLRQKGLSFKEAKDISFFSNVFTTHTPVPAGIDVFPNDLVEKYLGSFYRNELGITDKEFYKLGTIIKDKPPANFNMAHLAMNTASFVNGVSKLHSEVSRKMWVDGFKETPFDEIPIDYVTNGVHTKSHLSNEMNELFYRYLGSDFLQNISDKTLWEKIDEIPDEELWRTHERRKERLVAFARKRLRKQLIARGASSTEIEAAKEVLDASALTIGFARRFATYKRATLLFRDIERLANILCDTDIPVQLIIAGKAHPKDDEGKKLIQEIAQIAKKEHLRKKIVFIENYDMNVARYMVEGCDIWLNNPRRPMEASGTSGMKVIANGGLNFSVLDGWWDEAYDHTVGWKIGNGEDYADPDYQDEVEYRLIYEVLEKEIIPLYYERGEEKLPRKWISMMKTSMKKLGPEFNSNRMVKQYVEKFYLASLAKRKELTAKDWSYGKEFSNWKDHLIHNWTNVKFVNVKSTDQNGVVPVGEKYFIEAEVATGDLTNDDIEVQIYYGKVDDKNKAHANSYVTMTCVEDTKGKNKKYKGEIDCGATGQFGYTLRILPKHKLLVNQFELG
ncbi:MAG: alpha-glucan family phosphorylase, partial [Melioribacteraceae bacterium]|nr:alpha-glucan family phosphorylase [Melioribacteraceae bacterium]